MPASLPALPRSSGRTLLFTVHRHVAAIMSPVHWSEVVVTAPVRVVDLGGWTDTWFAGRGHVTNVAVGPGVTVRVVPSGGSGASHSSGSSRGSITLRSLGEHHVLDATLAVPGHPVIEAIVRSHPVDGPVSMFIDSSVPPGSGLGTSAAVAVALLAALRCATDADIDPPSLAAEAHALETGTGIQSGVQDHVAAAIGGVCHIEVDYPRFRAEQVSISREVGEALSARLVTVYFGRPHRSSDIHHQVIARLESADPQLLLEPLRELALEATAAFGAADLDALAAVMRRSAAAQAALDPRLVCADAQRLIELCGELDGAAKVNGAGGDGGSATVLLPADTGAARALVDGIDAVPGWSRLDLSVSLGGVTAVRR